MADPLLLRMDNLLHFIDGILNNDADEHKEEKEINDKVSSNLSAKYLDDSWKENRKTELSILESNGFKYRPDENIDANIERPIGHSTHNLFLKDKKSKKRFLITHHQSHKLNYKIMTNKLKESGFKIKELRMDQQQNRQQIMTQYFGFDKGCITALSLLNIENYEKENGIQWIVDSKLMECKQTMTICAGCNNPNDHTQHHVIDISMRKLVKMIETIGIEPVIIDF